MSVEREQYQACRRFQEYYEDTLCRRVGIKAPEPVAGQSVMDYRVETCRLFKRMFLPQNHESYQVNYRGLIGSPVALKPLESKLLRDCVVEAYNPNNVPPGEIREVVKTDSNGLKMREFIGRECFVKDMGRPGRRARFRQLSFADYK